MVDCRSQQTSQMGMVMRMVWVMCDGDSFMVETDEVTWRIDVTDDIGG